jgi:UDP-N-acetylglucosamine 3-dehydrogenase
VPERVRAAVIGAGVMGANHIRVLDELPDCELVAVADPNEARLRETIAGRAARGYARHRDLLDEERPDAVSIAAPTRLHAPIAVDCIERRIALLIEKPLAADVAEAERVQAAAEAAGSVLMAGYVERFNPAVRELKRRLDAGEAGRVIEARARRVGPFFERERDVGVVHDLATHDIDVLRYLLGAEVERAQGETKSGVRTPFEDALVGALRFEDGVVAALEVDWLTPVKQRELVVVGERGMFVVDYLAQTLRFFRDSGTPGAGGEPDLASFPAAGQAPLRAELECFLRVARGEEPPPVTAADGIAALRVAEALCEAARRGEPVLLSERSR